VAVGIVLAVAGGAIGIGCRTQAVVDVVAVLGSQAIGIGDTGQVLVGVITVAPTPVRRGAADEIANIVVGVIDVLTTRVGDTVNPVIGIIGPGGGAAGLEAADRGSGRTQGNGRHITCRGVGVTALTAIWPRLEDGSTQAVVGHVEGRAVEGRVRQ